MLTEIINIDSKDDGGIPRGGQGFKGIHEMRLAPRATISIVRYVARVIELVGLDQKVGKAKFRCQCRSLVGF
jgi:hypothetical protein